MCGDSDIEGRKLGMLGKRKGEAERHQLLLEATKRDSVALAIPEEDDDLSSQEEKTEEEKTLQEEEKDYMMISQC